MHALNLVVVGTMRQTKVLCCASYTVGEISHLLKYSPCRDTLRASNLIILQLYQVFKVAIQPDGSLRQYPYKASLVIMFQELWVKGKDVTADSEACARIHGVEA